VSVRGESCWRRPHLRVALTDDVPRLAALIGILGYPAAPRELRPRLERLLSRPDHVIVVAETDAHGIVGWIHGTEQELLEAERRCEIVGLVVAPEGRRRGIGARLVAAVEAWGKARGLHRIVVRSNVTRPESHPFYERLGYGRVKTQHVYARELSG
jgi:GNAT superfamily N-acetyltransferase